MGRLGSRKPTVLIGLQSLCNQIFGGVFCVVTLLFGCFVDVGAFVQGLSQFSPSLALKLYIPLTFDLG